MQREKKTVAVAEAALAGLRAGLRGDLVQPGSKNYDEARKVYNGAIDKRPALIVRAADTADVVSAVNFAREHDLPLAVRGGGHNGAGLAVAEGALVADLSAMKGVHVDPETRSVRVGGGATWGDVDYATHPFGLAVPTGIISSTGVGGLTLGGGHGYLTRKYGLTIDNLVSADVVLADGRMVTASAEENEDLFWAIRGGGGNFGVVTSFEFRGQPVSTVIAGPTLWPLERADEAMRFYRDFTAAASEDLYGFFAFLKVPPGPPFPEHLHFRTMCAVVWSYAGPKERFDEEFRPVRESEPEFEFVGEMPISYLNSMFDALMPSGLQWYWKHDFVNELSDEAISLHVEHGSKIPTLLSTMHLYPVDGAAHRVGDDETAFSYRGARWSAVYAGIDPDPANGDLITGWARDYWAALHPHSAGGAYVNMMMDDEGQDRIEASYRGNYARLAEVKAEYDPTNLFRVNQNIRPAKQR